MYKEITGNLITLAKSGQFDVIAHGCNCHCHMGAGIAPQMAAEFGANTYPSEHLDYEGDINKLGQVEFYWINPKDKSKSLFKTKDNNLAVVNAYTQFGFGKNHEGGKTIPLDYNALALCLKKMNHIFKGRKIGLPQIGCGLAGGDWNIVKALIENELEDDCDVTVVIYDALPPTQGKFDQFKSSKLFE